MDLLLRQLDARSAWDETLLQLPGPHLLQSWEWGAFKARHGWAPTRYLWQERGSGTQRAAASVLTRGLGRLPLRVMYVPKGPILDYSNDAMVWRVLDDLAALAERERALFIKIDPDVEPGSAEGRHLLGSLREHGWHRSREQVQFRNTVLINLSPSEEELLMGMKSKWRYNIRLAQRKGVTVHQGTLEELPLLYEMYEETAQRRAFVIRPERYYRDAWGSFIEHDLAQAFLAEVGGKAVAMVMVYRFGPRAYYMYGASLDIHREKMPNNLLQWEAMKWAKEHGCTTYDMWGAPDEVDESDPMWGVYRFKIGFGGEFVERVGAWDYPAWESGYRLYQTVMPRLLTALRWVYRQRLPDDV